MSSLPTLATFVMALTALVGMVLNWRRHPAQVRGDGATADNQEANAIHTLSDELRQAQTQLRQLTEQLGIVEKEVRKLRDFVVNVISSAAALGLTVTERGHLLVRRGVVTLVVEDDEGIRGALAALLQDMGHEVHAVADLPAALQVATTMPLDLMILDYVLRGGVTGIDVARAIRTQPGQQTVPVIVMTALNSDERVDAVIRDYAPQATIHKPYDDSEMEATIRSVLASRRVTPARSAQVAADATH